MTEPQKRRAADRFLKGWVNRMAALQTTIDKGVA